MKVEFSNGGPADGRIQEIDGMPETILVYALSDSPGKIELEKPTERVAVVTHVYRSASRLTRDGAQIFDYKGRTRS